eukprot:9006635-Alexandrium_andersonii.AAC.1
MKHAKRFSPASNKAFACALDFWLSSRKARSRSSSRAKWQIIQSARSLVHSGAFCPAGSTKPSRCVEAGVVDLAVAPAPGHT